MGALGPGLRALLLKNVGGFGRQLDRVDDMVRAHVSDVNYLY